MPVSLSQQRRNVLLLAICQGIFICGQTTLIFLGGLVGFQLATDKALATLPISAVILGNALMTIPASLFMRRVGRRAGFMTGAVVGISGMLVCATSIYFATFWPFVLGGLMIGFYNAFCQYYRFAAADAADDAFRAKAISLVMAGGVVAGVIGPELATRTRDLTAPITYMGSYLSLAVLTAVALLLVSFVRIPPLSESERADSGRPLSRILRQPGFLAAVSASMVAYGVMSLLMTATPLAMIGCGFADTQAGTVIQWHVVGMFAPSFMTGHLITRLGLHNVMMAGAALLAVCVGVSMAGLDFFNFWAGLFLLGVGWNFLFVGATTMLTTVHTAAERAKTQAANDFLVFGATASASLLSGALLHLFGWFTVNLVAVPFVFALIVLTIWLATSKNRVHRTT